VGELRIFFFFFFVNNGFIQTKKQSVCLKMDKNITVEKES